MSKLSQLRQVPHNKTDTKTWSNAQVYEFEAAKSFMESEYFHLLMIRNKKLRDEKSNELNMEVFYDEFFNNNPDKLNCFIDELKGKNCLEIGPSCATILGSWWFSKTNFIIEPLFQISENTVISKGQIWL